MEKIKKEEKIMNTSTKLSASQKGFAPILIVILIALAVGGYLFYQKQAKPVSFPQPSPSPATSSEASSSADIVNWKTYQNSNPNYNYSLKYPENIFIYPQDFQLRIQSWTNTKGTQAPLTGDKPDRLLLHVVIHDPDEIGYNTLQFYKDSIGFQIQTKQTELGLVKISDIETNGIKGATYIEIIGTLQNPKPSCFLAVWFKNEKYYSLRLCAAGEDRLRNQKQLFDQILSTFKFLP